MIKVENGVSEEKIKKIRQLGYRCLEVDVLGIFEALYTKNQVSNDRLFFIEIIHGTKFKQWIFHPKIESEELKLQQQAIAKPIKHYRSKYGDQFIVKNCPLEKRKWKHPQINNHSFAHVFQDCLTCPFCFNVDYQRIYRGNQIFQGNPKIVNCFGGDFQATCTR